MVSSSCCLRDHIINAPELVLPGSFELVSDIPDGFMTRSHAFVTNLVVVVSGYGLHFTPHLVSQSFVPTNRSHDIG